MSADAEKLFESASIKFKSKDYKAAIADINLAIGLEPHNPTYYKLRADCFDFEGKNVEACSDYTFVIQNSSDMEEKKESYEFRAFLYLCRNQYENALQDINWLIDNGVNAPYWFDERSKCKRELGLFEEAIKDFSFAINEKRSNMLLLERAETYFKMGNIEAAYQDAAQLVDMVRTPVYFVYRYFLYRKMGDFGAADRDITFLVELGVAPSVNTRFTRAEFYYEIGRYEDAISDFTYLLSTAKFAKSGPRLNEWIGKCYYRLDKLNEALIYFNKGQVLQGKEPSCDADTYIKQNRVRL